MHPGSKKVLDFEKVEEMYQKIKSTKDGTENHFVIEEVDRDYLKNLKGTQAARVAEYPEKIRYIANDIDDEMGDISFTKPLTIAIDENDVCGIGETEFRINGYHTQKGILKSKHAVAGKIIKVNLTGWNKAEIEQLAFDSNEYKRVKESEPTLEDYEKRLFTLYIDNDIEPTSFQAEKVMKPLTTKDSGKVVRIVKKMIELKRRLKNE